VWGPHYCGTRGAAHLQGVCGGDQAGQKGGGPFNEDPTASIFHIGNDELVLLLSTHGYAQVRQDEGGPKLLNDYSPSQSQFGGGLGYFVDTDTGEVLLSTFYGCDAPQQYEREFGVGCAQSFTCLGRPHMYVCSLDSAAA
jgi:hypothetical protein